MSRIIAVLAVTLGTMIVVAVIVFAAGDRGTLVPSPEAAAAGFVRQIASGRYLQTRQYVSTASRAWLSPSRLAAWRADIESRIGSISRVDPSGAVADRNNALANLRLHGPAGTAAASVPLRREQGLWKVTGTPALIDEEEERR
jgi:hypothetical protein